MPNLFQLFCMMIFKFSQSYYIYSVRVYVLIISKYARKIVGMQNRQVACVHGTQDQKQSTFSKFKPAHYSKES